MIINRRSFLAGLLAAPIIVRPGIIMPVKPLQDETAIDLIAIPRLEPGDVVYQITGRDEYGGFVRETVHALDKSVVRYKSICEITNLLVVGADRKPHLVELSDRPIFETSADRGWLTVRMPI